MSIKPPLPPLPANPPSRRCGWRRMPGTVAIPNAYRRYIPSILIGVTARSLSTAAQRWSVLQRKWAKELEYRLIKELWAFDGARIAVRFAYEWRDDSGNWYRSFGNENWEFNQEGLMINRHACINDMPIREQDRRFHWPLGRRPDDVPALSDFGF